MLATSSIRIDSEVELLLPLPAGTPVRCWDGTSGHVEWSTHAEVGVVYPSRLVGRGPWTYERWQVEVAS